MTGIREALVEAANSVDGINVSPYYRQTTKVFTGFVTYQRSTRDASGLGFMDSWSVVIVLPQDAVAAEKAIEEKFDALNAALKKELVIQTVQPITLVFDQAQVNALSVEGVRGHLSI